MKFDKKGEKIDSYNSGLMKKGGVGPKGTAMSHMWGGESVEMGQQMGGNRDFLKGPGSQDRNSEGTFNVKHSGIVKQGMDSGIYKMQQSGMHKLDSGFHKIEAGATAGAMDTLQDSRDKENKMKDAGMEELGEGLEDVQDAVESEPQGGDANIYTDDKGYEHSLQEDGLIEGSDEAMADYDALQEEEDALDLEDLIIKKS